MRLRPMSDDSLEHLTRETFAGRLGETFVIRIDDGPDFELRLTEANALGGESDDRDPFSLIFLGPPEPVLQQAIYSLEHPELGAIGLFLVPVGLDKKRTGMQYEAVFS